MHNTPTTAQRLACRPPAGSPIEISATAAVETPAADALCTRSRQCIYRLLENREVDSALDALAVNIESRAQAHARCTRSRIRAFDLCLVLVAAKAGAKRIRINLQIILCPAFVQG